MKFTMNNFGRHENKPLWRGGKATLQITKVKSVVLEWSIQTSLLHVGYALQYDNDKQLYFGCGLFSVWLKFKGKFVSKPERHIELAWYGGGLHWSIWTPINEWTRGTPKWRDGSWYPLDTLLGKQRYGHRVLSKETITVSLPEGDYPCKVELFESRWKRDRWPRVKILLRAEIEPDTPIPVPGKGDNSWDCDDDAAYSMTCQAATAQEAADKLKESILSQRLKYGGENWEPSTNVTYGLHVVRTKEKVDDVFPCVNDDGILLGESE
jgi:hypothetical protein